MLKERPMKGKTDLLTVKLMVCKKCNSKPIPFSQIQRAAKAMEPSFDLVDNLDWERFYTIFKIDEPFEPRDPFTKKMRKIRASGGGGCFLIGDKIVANKEQQNV
jgi:hypothetical protein